MIYLDCAATTPIDPRVEELTLRYLSSEFGNAGSRTHDFGDRARRAVENARRQIARAVGAGRGEVVFTSGATESNNLAILGLAEFGLRTGRQHLVTTQIEHHAVLEPLQALERRGFEVTRLPVHRGGYVEPEVVQAAVRADTLLVSVMQVNNETGIVQPIREIAELLAGSGAYFHVDAAQGFGQSLEPLRHERIDLMSISGHKIYAPKGIGALILRRRNGVRPPLEPLMYGGGQELGLRPGTLPVHLIAGLGLAAQLASDEWKQREDMNRRFRERLLAGIARLNPIFHGDVSRGATHIVNLAFPGLESDDVIDALQGFVAISSGAACTTQSQTCSHVLTAMNLPERQLASAIRLSWFHGTPEVDWQEFVARVRGTTTRT